MLVEYMRANAGVLQPVGQQVGVEAIARRARSGSPAHLGPVNAMDANANGWHGAPIKAADEAKTERLREEDNAEWRPMPPVPFGLLPKTPIAALQSLAGYPTRLRLRALRWAFSAVQRVCAHSVNRPWYLRPPLDQRVDKPREHRLSAAARCASHGPECGASSM